MRGNTGGLTLTYLSGAVAVLAVTDGTWGQRSYRVYDIGVVTTAFPDLDFGRMGINDKGEIAFTDFDAGPAGEDRAFVWLPAPNPSYPPEIGECVAFALPLPTGAVASTAHDINDQGFVSGSVTFPGPEQHAFIWELRNPERVNANETLC